MAFNNGVPTTTPATTTTSRTSTVSFILFLTIATSRCLLSPELLRLDLRVDPNSTSMASIDFGRRTSHPPSAVLYPSSVVDITTLVRSSYASPVPFAIAAKGHGHSLHGQAQAHGGVVIEMRSLNNNNNNNNNNDDDSDRASTSAMVVMPMRINVSLKYVDVGGEQLWIDVLHETLKHGLTPKSWTDYLYLTVGGTLSNAGIGGQTFRHGPQISNVYEMEVITGRGEILTCSRRSNSDLFYAVLGGLGQFGIITRARIALESAPRKVKWIRRLYSDFSAFKRDQELLISLNQEQGGFNYIEGFVIVNESHVNNWRSSFFSPSNPLKLSSVPSQAQQGMLYCLEVAKYYHYYNHDRAADTIDQEVDSLLRRLNFIPGFVFTKNISYLEFLNRVRKGELMLRSKGLWDIPHPWLNLFIPASRISDFDIAVFKKILKQNKTMGPILVYPLNKSKWDDKMSAVVPDEQVFYSIGLLRSTVHDWEYLVEQNRNILKFCDEVGIGYKLYLPHHKTKVEWKRHFGPKWHIFVESKMKFDPKAILAPGHGIFPSLLTRIGSRIFKNQMGLRTTFSNLVQS